jgi:P4 family phage/plasmid primase-like protien
MKISYFKNKANAIKRLQIERTTNPNSVLVNRSITKYFVIPSLKHFVDLIHKEVTKDFYEFIPSNIPVPLFFDIEIYNEHETFYFNSPEQLIDVVISRVSDTLNNTSYKMSSKLVLESHSDEKKSFHVIVSLVNLQNQLALFSNVKELKDFYKRLNLATFKDTLGKHLVDPSVYREGLFRTVHSSKNNEYRPLVTSPLSDPFEDDIQTMVTFYHTQPHVIVDIEQKTVEVIEEFNPVHDHAVNIPEDLTDQHKSIVVKFVKKEYHYLANKIRDIFIDREYNCIIVALDDQFCPFADKEHKSNNQYIVIDTKSAKQKCHDSDCKQQKHLEIKLEMYPKELHEVIKKCLKINKQELELIDKAIEECKNYITENFDASISNVSFDRNAMVFRGNVGDRSLAKILKGKCPECNVEHQISDTGYCLRCKECHSIFPKNQIIPVDGRYKALNSFWMNYNQLVNHGTINNIINIYNNGGDMEFSCDIKLDNGIFRNKEVTSIINQVLDGHKVTMISKLLNTINKNFMYSKNNWYYFTGSIWKLDSDNIEMKKEIMDLSKLFDRIKTHYDSKQTDDATMSLNKNIKSLINKFHKPGFQDDIIKGAKIYFNDEDFISKLNSKKHLVPFGNGVYDLLEHKFRKTKKEDYVNLTMNYDYNEHVNNHEVHTFLQQVLPIDCVRSYVLKKMSECLNGDIPNTYFLMFIGDTGANGKSQLLNLMKAAMGDFGEKVEVTLLTRKRSNANEANTEKIKLMNKRFAFLSEPEDGEKINIGLLKELTGSEEIVARGLYQDAVSFVMEAKLFLACNELPEIKGEDTALWRRIRVIDFPSRFVDEPKNSNEYKIDRTLPSRMREDHSWRQTFINILLNYYYKDVKEPFEVQVKTNEYRQENNDFFNWMDENIMLSENAILQLAEVCELFIGKKVGPRIMTKYKKEVEKYVKEKFKDVNWLYQKGTINDQNYRGWLNLCIKNM